MFSDESFAPCDVTDCATSIIEHTQTFPTEIEELIGNIKRSIGSTRPISKDMYEAAIDFLDGEIQTLLLSHTNIYVIGTVEYIKTVGDTHGSLDLLEILNHLILDENHHVVFMGDYVDRGSFSLDNLLLILFLKVKFPNFVHVLRGNHEDERVCSSYQTVGFRFECQKKITLSKFSTYWDKLMDFFAHMPLACIANGYFYVHGGLPMGKDGKILDFDTVNRIERICHKYLPEPADDSSQCFVQMLWGDPDENFGISKRGADTYVFSAENTKEFFRLYRDFNIGCVIRAHEVQRDGYVVNHCDETKMPICMTVFSASRYCGMQNKGAFGIVSAEGVIGMYTYTSNVDLRDKQDLGQLDEEESTPRYRQIVQRFI